MKINDSDAETIGQCALCGDVHPVNDSRFQRLLGLSGQPYSVVRCSSCGLRWLSPRPTQKIYRELYTDENYFGGSNSVEHYQDDLVPHLSHYFEARVHEISRILPPESKPLLLDVGAATGDWVFQAIKLGYQAVGVEFSEDAIATAKRKHHIELIQGDLGSEQLEVNRFDLIHMNHVFEHLPDPSASLVRCRQLLKENGWLIMEVPQQFDNDLDRLKKLLGMKKKPSFNSYSIHHAYFYTPSTLVKLLEKHGFAIKKIRTANPARTAPLTPRNRLLRIYLHLADRLHQGGNIIEVWAQKNFEEVMQAED